MNDTIISMKLGIFDSGIGGKAIAATLQNKFPHAEIIVVNDSKNVPYGSKSPGEIITLTEAAIQSLIIASCDVIILACNTATAIAIETLRLRYPQQKFIGIEPMIKTASLRTKTRIVAVCATPATLHSVRYHKLVNTYGKHLTILEPDCSDWAYMIENNRVNHQTIERIINEVCDRGVDIIVLGCTHYHWIKDLIRNLANGRAGIIEPSDAIERQVRTILKLG